MKRYMLSLFLFPTTGEAQVKEPLSQVKFADVSDYVPEIKSFDQPNLNESGSAFLPPGIKPKDAVTSKSIIYVSGGRWPKPSAIDVCWINPEAGGEIVADLQNWVSLEYKRAGIGFNWLGKCVDARGPNEIRVYFKRSHTWKDGSWSVSGGGGLSYIGPVDAQLGGSEGTGTMNIQISKDIDGYGRSGYRQWFIETTRGTAVHEFGHALGLAHEQERSDAPICQDQRGNLPNGGSYLFVGKYDPQSIMNYCQSGGDVQRLSEGDIIGLKTLYPPSQGTGAPAPGTTQPKGSYTIRARTDSRCVDVKANATENGAILQHAACNQTDAQSFFAEYLEGDYWQLRGTRSGRCMDLKGGMTTNGTRIQLFDCNKTDAQKFRFQDVGAGWISLQNKSGKCIALDQSSQSLVLQSCGRHHYGFFPISALQPIGALKPTR